MSYTYFCQLNSLDTFQNNTISGANFTYYATDGSNTASVNSNVIFDYANNPTTYLATSTLTQDTVNNWILTHPDTINLQSFLTTSIESTPTEFPNTQTIFPWTTALQFANDSPILNVWSSNASSGSASVTRGQLTKAPASYVYVNIYNNVVFGGRLAPGAYGTSLASTSTLSKLPLIDNTIYLDYGMPVTLSGPGIYTVQNNSVTLNVGSSTVTAACNYIVASNGTTILQDWQTLFSGITTIPSPGQSVGLAQINGTIANGGIVIFLGGNNLQVIANTLGTYAP